MSDNQNGQNIAEETATPMPSEEKSTEESQPTLPDGVSERTAEQYAKLVSHNKELAAENAKLKGQSQRGSVLDEFHSGNLNNAPTNNNAQAVAEQFVDDSGYVDTVLLNATLAEAKRQADEARRIAQQNQESIQRFQETEEVRKAHTAFPQLDPNNTEKFDPKFYNLVRNELIGQLMEGKKDVLEAATKVSELYQPNVTNLPTPQQKQTISNREQASVSTGISKKQSTTSSTHEELVEGTMRGDKKPSLNDCKLLDTDFYRKVYKRITKT